MLARGLVPALFLGLLACGAEAGDLYTPEKESAFQFEAGTNQGTITCAATLPAKQGEAQLLFGTSTSDDSIWFRLFDKSLKAVESKTPAVSISFDDAELLRQELRVLGPTLSIGDLSDPMKRAFLDKIAEEGLLRIEMDPPHGGAPDHRTPNSRTYVFEPLGGAHLASDLKACMDWFFRKFR